jgi:uncharacterized protein YdhG (YjbR/CyaY superfamily)
MASRPKVTTVAGYLALLAPGQVRQLKQVIATIRKAVPGCTLVISYGIPAFKREKVFIYCAAFKSHIGIYPPVRRDARLITTLKPYANPKGNLRFPFDERMPHRLIARVARALAKER